MGGGAPKNTTTTTQIDPQMKGWIQNNVNFAQGIANSPYQAYQGQMVAPFTPMQQLGFQSALNTATNSTGSLAQNQAQQLALNAGTMGASGLQGLGWNQLQANAVNGGQGFDPNMSQQFMSPFQQNVIDTTNQQIDRNLAQTQNSTNAQAISAGAFGGTRQAVASAENARNADQLKAQTAANLNQANFSQAQQAAMQGWDSAQNRNLSAALNNQQNAFNVQSGNLASQQAASNLGLSGQLQAAQLLGQTGMNQRNIAASDASMLSQYGQQQQDLQNAYNQWLYQNNYLNPQAWQLQGLNALTSATGGAPVGSSVTGPGAQGPGKAAGALGGAAMGAQLGSYFGPGYGTAIGAVAGGLYGYFSS